MSEDLYWIDNGDYCGSEGLKVIQEPSMTEDPFLDKLSAELRQLMGQKSAVELTEEAHTA